MRETIQLEEGDSLPVIRYKLERAASKRVAVLVPPTNAALHSDVALNVLRRVADGLMLDMVLVTDDRAVVKAARRAGVRTVPSEQGAQRMGALRARAGFYGAPPETAPRSAVAERTLEAARSMAASARRRPAHVIAVLGLGIVALGVVVAAALAVLPSATVTLDPAGKSASAEMDLVASTTVTAANAQQRKVPARQVQLEVIGELGSQTTGKVTSPDKQATGDVVFANKTSEAVTIPKGTAVRTTDGKAVRYYTLHDAQLAASYGATVRVPVQAFDAGPAGNTEALTVRTVDGETGYKVDVLNDKPIGGGSDKRVSVASNQDRDNLRATLMQRLQQESYTRLVGSLDSYDWVPPETLEVVVVDESFDKKVDEPSETLMLTMKVRVTGQAVDGRAVRTLISDALQAKGEKGLVVNAASLQVEQPVGGPVVEGNEIRFKASGSGLLAPAIDLKAAANRIAGMDVTRAVAWLNGQYSLRQSATVTIQPKWWKKVPWLPFRIHVLLAGGR